MSSYNIILEEQKKLRRAERVHVQEKVLTSSEKIYQNADQFIIITESVVKSESSSISLTLESEDEVFIMNENNSMFDYQSSFGITIFQSTHTSLHNGTFQAFLPANSDDSFFIKYLQVTVIYHKHDGLGRLTQKIESDSLPSSGNKELAYWNRVSPQIIFTDTQKIRKGAALPKGYAKKYFVQEFLNTYYNLCGFEYGRWTTQEDRINFLSGMGLALYDLNKVLNLSAGRIGLNRKLGIAFGSRGSGKALAHFEPDNYVINLTRQKRSMNKKDYNLFLSASARKTALTMSYVRSAGLTSFVHEYGHALDFYAGEMLFGSRLSPLSHSRQLGHSYSKKYDNLKTAEGAMQRLIKAICLDENGNKSEYFNRVAKYADDREKREYWLSKVEIFARAFEVYVFVKLKDKGYYNIFLSKGKFSDESISTGFDKKVYMTVNECKNILPQFDEVIAEIKKLIVVESQAKILE